MNNKSNKKIRLQKYISESGYASRRKAEGLISKGEVKLNGQVVTTMGLKVDPEVDLVEINNQKLKIAPKQLVMLHKPLAFITSSKDPEGRRTIYQLLSKKYQSFSTVGRLDYNTSGLLLLTNDGDFANHLMHPRYEIVRTYQAQVRGSIPEKVLNQIAKGVQLEDGPISAQASLINSKRDSSLIQLEFKEGRNRIVRRLMDKLGYPVMRLKRVAFGPFSLGRLAKGEIKVFTEKEFQAYRVQIGFSP